MITVPPQYPERPMDDDDLIRGMTLAAHHFSDNASGMALAFGEGMDAGQALQTTAAGFSAVTAITLNGRPDADLEEYAAQAKRMLLTLMEKRLAKDADDE